MAGPVSVDPVEHGAFWVITFANGRGNILDTPTMTALEAVLDDAEAEPAVKAICLTGAGEHFSFGSSVQEHLPDRVAGMLKAFHRLILRLAGSPLVSLAAVRGRCLGGGLELASVCHRIVAEHGARFGQPEIALGVFAPVASLTLEGRVGRAAAEDLCLTGRTIAAGEARDLGLVDELVHEDPAAAGVRWARRHLGARSASSLRLATQAVRAPFVAHLRAHLPELERLYLDELMATDDAVEGLRAFLEKRPPQWTNE